MIENKIKLLFVVNAFEYFLSHRFDIAKYAIKMGYEVHVASSSIDPRKKSSVDALKRAGIICHQISLSRGGQNPLTETLVILRLLLLFKKVNPSLVHLVTIKPVVYGVIAARLAGVKNVICAIAGLGSLFIATDRGSRLKANCLLTVIKWGLKNSNRKFIFQNIDDKNVLLRKGLVSDADAVIFRGSGVNLSKYRYNSEPSLEKVRVTLASRIIKDKGISEFLLASKIVLSSNVDVEFRLLGSLDEGNPSSYSEKEFKKLISEFPVNYLGYCDDIESEYVNSNIVCLPSYREGLPKSLVEAAACGRAVVTTDVPGCRDAIIHKKTGLLVPARDAKSLAKAIEFLALNVSVRESMGYEGRKLAESDFDVEKIVSQHISLYEKVLRQE